MTIVTVLDHTLFVEDGGIDPDPPGDPTGGDLPKRIATGMGIRSVSRENAKNKALITAGDYPGFETIEVNWRDIHTGPGTLSTTKVNAIIAELDRLDALGLGGPIRFFGGYQAPDWLVAICGGFDLYTNDGSAGRGGAPSPSDPKWRKLPRPCLIYWHPQALVYYEELFTLIPSSIYNHPAFCGYSFFLPTTQYAEPGVQQMANADNRANFMAAGYTKAKQMTAWAEALKVHARVLNPRFIATNIAFNYIQHLTDSGEQEAPSSASVIEMINLAVSLMGKMVVLENNSWQSPTTKYPTMYAKFEEYAKRTTPYRSPIWLQTETGPKTELLWDITPASRSSIGPRHQMALGGTRLKVNAFEMFSGTENDSRIADAEEASRSGLPIGTLRWNAITPSEAGTFNDACFNRSIGLHKYYYVKKGLPIPDDPGDPDPTPSGDLRKMNGVVGWVSTMPSASYTQIASKTFITGLSAHIRWDDLTTNGTTFDWTTYDRVRDVCEAQGKFWAGMLIAGNRAKGLPAYAYAGLPADELINADGGDFIAFWSDTGFTRWMNVMRAISDRYKSSPKLAQWRVTGFWSTHGEPWFMGGSAGLAKWQAQWNAYCTRKGTPSLANFDGLVAAYQAYEKKLWTTMASIFPSYVTLSQAAGDAFKDVVATKPHTDPNRHPQRLATWSEIRTTVGNRFVGQFNGAGPGDGASGYITWLSSAFGPSSAKPSRIWAQPVGGVTSGNVRLTASEFVAMLNTLTTKGYSAFELYQSDALAATDSSPTGDGLTMKNAIISHINDWKP